MSARPYLNEASFPAPSEDDALRCLADLRKGISLLLREKAIALPVMCNSRVSDLSLTPNHGVLVQFQRFQGGIYKDTIEFFLRILDQAAPAYSRSEPEIQEAVSEFAIEGLDIEDLEGFDADYQKNRIMPIVLCGRESGVLLSLGSAEQWRRKKLSFTVMLANDEDLHPLSCANVFDKDSATGVAEDLRVEGEELILENWDQLTGGAGRDGQVREWLEDPKRGRVLITVLMRTVRNAYNQNYSADGNLIKKLQQSTGTLVIFEIRAWHNGSNNVRLLFVRKSDGTIKYCYAGIKTDDNWYDHAIAHTRNVADD